jgi:hypothetical protein
MSNVRIVVAQRGWVFVGEVTQTESETTITRAKTVRRWGTTKGLGELAGGPTDATKLDEAGTVRMHPLAVVAMIDCDAEAWRARLG